MNLRRVILCSLLAPWLPGVLAPSQAQSTEGTRLLRQPTVSAAHIAFEYGGEFQNAVSLTLLIGVLMLRPQGLFGRPAARRV